MSGNSFDKLFGRGVSKVTVSLSVFVGLVLFTWAFAGESTGRSIEPSWSAVKQEGKQVRAQEYREVWVQGLTIGDGFAGMYANRTRKTVRIQFAGPCGLNDAGPVRVRNRKFRAKVSFRGGGWKVSGKFTKNNRKIKGKLRSWSKGCNTGTRNFLLARV